jgi:hypothetical protein
MGAFYDNLCHIGNFDPQLGNAGQYPFVYGSCANKLGVAGLTGKGNNTTYRNNYSTGLGPRIGFAWDIFGHHNTTIRGGYGIYFVREDVGTVDQLSFQAPYLPIAGAPGLPGCLSTFFSPDAPPECDQIPGQGNLNALPKAGDLSPSFVPCLGVFQGFSGGDTTGAASFGCAAGSPGLIASQNLFVLTVPRHFVVPNTQQWNLTIQRDLGRQWIMELGYVGSHGIHLRETSTNIQAQLVTAANLPNRAGWDAIHHHREHHLERRSSLQPAGRQWIWRLSIFANDAYSHYHSFQATLSVVGARIFQSLYILQDNDATSSGNTALNTAFNDESNISNSYGLLF